MGIGSEVFEEMRERLVAIVLQEILLYAFERILWKEIEGLLLKVL